MLVSNLFASLMAWSHKACQAQASRACESSGKPARHMRSTRSAGRGHAASCGTLAGSSTSSRLHSFLSASTASSAADMMVPTFSSTASGREQVAVSACHRLRRPPESAAPLRRSHLSLQDHQ